jgi:hypothetical protein
MLKCFRFVLAPKISSLEAFLSHWRLCIPDTAKYEQPVARERAKCIYDSLFRHTFALRL